MKVVILHQHFKTPASGGAIRSWYLAQALLQNGIQVTVITAHNEKTYLITQIDGVEVHYLPVAYDNKFGFTGRSSAFVRFVWKSTRLTEILRGASVCYAISVPLTTGIAAIWIKRKHGIPFIFEVGDLWPEAPIQMGFVKNYFLKRALYALETEIYKQAASVVALSTSIQSAIQKQAPEKKTDLIPNMSDCDFFVPSAKDQLLESRFQVTGKFVVSYIGALGLANGLDYFIECANKCRKQELPIHFILCGEGAVKERLQKHAAHLGLHNLTFAEFRNRDGVREVLNVTDAAFVCYKNVPVLETGSPNKYFDGLAAGKMMIVNVKGWMKEEVEENECGIYVNPADPLDFVGKIRDFLNDKPKLHRYQNASRELAERKYSRQILGQKFARIFNPDI